ncbi:ComF family protein [Litorivivens lipolytica]|uniref:ComF family protein n=1 Tax=Litorivivens lipolytica TaxID=1524264 RepID=A0A7W4W645_9GAMM|nr:ComF family protein [Litorivivens lipolytica]MBB3047788.1 ComF family protein [Litorivivens lipolytica]
MVNSKLKHLSYKLFPGQCQLCLSPSRRPSDICIDCERDLPWLQACCRRCALPLATGDLCGHCLKQAPVFDQCIACWEYGFPIDALISRFKYHGDKACGALLAELAQTVFSQTGFSQTAFSKTTVDMLIPVPMHWRRQLTRGYNQTEILANHWGYAFNIPVRHAIKRTKATPTQQGLSASARRRNLLGAFALPAPDAVRGKHVVLVDDVLTTGATANTLAAILRRAGAAEISIWCLARTP